MTSPERRDAPDPTRVEHRVERTYEVTATPEEVWDAIATAEGISAWMMPTRLEPRVGGEAVFDVDSPEPSVGVVTDYTPGRRFAYEEPWPMTDEMRAWVAEVDGHEVTDADMAAVSAIATEFLVESSGGSCVVRVVTSAYGRGASWEDEFFSEMANGWVDLLDRLSAHLGGSA